MHFVHTINFNFVSMSTVIKQFLDHMAYCEGCKNLNSNFFH